MFSLKSFIVLHSQLDIQSVWNPCLHGMRWGPPCIPVYANSQATWLHFENHIIFQGPTCISVTTPWVHMPVHVHLCVLVCLYTLPLVRWSLHQRHSTLVTVDP